MKEEEAVREVRRVCWCLVVRETGELWGFLSLSPFTPFNPRKGWKGSSRVLRMSSPTITEPHYLPQVQSPKTGLHSAPGKGKILEDSLSLGSWQVSPAAESLIGEGPQLRI